MSAEPYILRLLDECRDEINRSDSKASILFAAVAGSTALLANSLLDSTTELRTGGAVITVLSLGSGVILVSAMVLLGLAVIPRVGSPEVGKARYFEEHAQFETHQALLAALTEGAQHSEERHAQQLLIQSRIARRKYRYLRWAIYTVGIAMAMLGIALFVVAIR